MREILSLHIGQAGIQIGNACWELYCLEHDINEDGQLINGRRTSSQDNCNTFFASTQAGKYVPRALLIDLEPSVIDQVKLGRYRELFSENMMISGKEDAANNFARGRYSLGREAINAVKYKIRKFTETCDQFQGFMIFEGYGGGTGSGFASLVREAIHDDFGKKTNVELIVSPSPHLSTVIVEPYNAIFATHHSLNYMDCSLLMDNEALFNICQQKLRVPRPTYKNLNRIVAQVISSITASLRFDGTLNVELVELQTNLIPFPRIHFPLVSYSPLRVWEKVHFEDMSPYDLLNECFEPGNQMVKCNTKRGKYLACCVLFRGDVAPRDVNYAISFLKTKRNITFVNWCPTGFKIGLNFQCPKVVEGSDLTYMPRSCCTIANTTRISKAWSKLNRNFDLMFSRRAFVHWFTSEGMEQDEFRDARENLATLEKDYEEIEST